LLNWVLKIEPLKVCLNFLPMLAYVNLKQKP
jgi:hypothetical protein